MKFTFNCNHIIVAVLIVIYVTMPTTIFANATAIEAGFPSVQAIYSMTAAAPCDDCPCSDERGSSCCDSTFCCCACHAPLSQSFRLAYAPVIAVQSFREPLWSLPQVYRPIFVPPQNIS
jgi:hypothetical protein